MGMMADPGRMEDMVNNMKKIKDYEKRLKDLEDRYSEE